MSHLEFTFVSLLLLVCALPTDCRLGIVKTEEIGKEYVNQLTKENFNASVEGASTRYALVEFYASWCPACRKFKPTFEKVGVLFNHPKSPYGGDIYVAAADCKTQPELCKRFQVERYPTILWAEKSVMATGDRMPTSPERIDEVIIDVRNRTAEAIVDWINSKVGRSYSTSVELLMLPPKQAGKAQQQISTEAVAELHDIEEATAMAYNIAIKETVLSEDNRLPLIHFVELLSYHHPSIRCREGSQRVLKKIEASWKESGPDLDILKSEPICGPSFPQDFWKACKGYTCGLWMLFHSISVRLDDDEGAAWLDAIRGFVQYFFKCDVCRTHFLGMSSKEKVSDVKTRKDVVLWLWRAHNQVNKRIGDEEVSTGLVSEKQQWPPATLCATCVSSQDPLVWNEVAVLTFLFQHYKFPRDSAIENGGGAVGEEVKGGEKKVFGRMEGGEVGEDGPSLSTLGGPVIALSVLSIAFACTACAWRSRHRRRRSTLGPPSSLWS